MLFSRTCKHLHRGVSQPIFPWLFSLFSLPPIFFSDPHYTDLVCCTILVSAVCYCYWSGFLLLQRNCVPRDKESVSTCLHWGGGGRRQKVTDITWRAKGWLIRKLTEIIAGLAVVLAAGNMRRSHSNQDAGWGRRSSVGQLVPDAAAQLKHSWGAEIPEEPSSENLSVLRKRQTLNKPAPARIKETCINPRNKLRIWKEVNGSLSIQGLRITEQDVHIDALWLFRHEPHRKAGLKAGSGLDISSCSGLRADCTTYGGFCLPQMWVNALKSHRGGLANSQTKRKDSFKWQLGDFSLTGLPDWAQSWRQWVRGSWPGSWGCGRVRRVHLLRPLWPHLCHRSISLVGMGALLCFGAWNWTALFKSADAHVTVFAGTVLNHFSIYFLLRKTLQWFVIVLHQFVWDRGILNICANVFTLESASKEIILCTHSNTLIQID